MFYHLHSSKLTTWPVPIWLDSSVGIGSTAPVSQTSWVRIPFKPELSEFCVCAFNFRNINFVTVLYTVLILPGISCYHCESNTSFGECSTKQETVNCAFPRNYCFKQKNTTGGKNDQETLFYKGCTSADQCRKKGNNSLECCKDDLCNTGNQGFRLCTCQYGVRLCVSLCVCVASGLEEPCLRLGAHTYVPPDNIL